MLERSFKSENQVILSVIYICDLKECFLWNLKKTVTSALVVLSLFSIMSPSIVSVRVFADDVTTTEVSEISTQEQK